MITKPDPRLPPEGRLRAALAQVLGLREPFRIERSRNAYQGAFASEVVRAGTDGSDLRAYFVKYGQRGTHAGRGYWGGVQREAWAYAHLLPHLPLSRLRCHGSYRDPVSTETWLFLEFRPTGQRLNLLHEEALPAALSAAVEALATLHAHTSTASAVAWDGGLPVYDEAYFGGWLERTRKHARLLADADPSLDELIRRAAPSLNVLARGPRCIVHGEAYPKNVLVDGNTTYLIDWQSPAVARGEIDLASLLEGWEAYEGYASLVERYRRARWPQGAPSDFDEAFRAARLYWPLRWLGETPAGALHPRRRGYFATLRRAAENVVPGRAPDARGA